MRKVPRHNTAPDAFKQSFEIDTNKPLLSAALYFQEHPEFGTTVPNEIYEEPLKDKFSGSIPKTYLEHIVDTPSKRTNDNTIIWENGKAVDGNNPVNRTTKRQMSFKLPTINKTQIPALEKSTSIDSQETLTTDKNTTSPPSLAEIISNKFFSLKEYALSIVKSIKEGFVFSESNDKDSTKATHTNMNHLNSQETISNNPQDATAQTKDINYEKTFLDKSLEEIKNLLEKTSTGIEEFFNNPTSNPKTSFASKNSAFTQYNRPNDKNISLPPTSNPKKKNEVPKTSFASKNSGSAQHDQPNNNKTSFSQKIKDHERVSAARLKNTSFHVNISTKQGKAPFDEQITDYLNMTKDTRMDIFEQIEAEISRTRRDEIFAKMLKNIGKDGTAHSPESQKTISNPQEAIAQTTIFSTKCKRMPAKRFHRSGLETKKQSKSPNPDLDQENFFGR